jgi:hypothetical protein
MNGKLDTGEEEGCINFLIARECPDFSEARDVRENRARDIAIQCLSNVTGCVGLELSKYVVSFHLRRNLRKCEAGVKNNRCILGLRAGDLRTDGDRLAVWPNDTIHVKQSLPMLAS